MRQRKELFQYTLEVEQYIEQIKFEENQQLNVKKTLHSKRLKNWYDILTQIKDWMITKDYHEYLLIYNDPNYTSTYFEGFTKLVEKFKKLMNEQYKDKLHRFISDNTKKDISRIKSDFS